MTDMMKCQTLCKGLCKTGRIYEVSGCHANPNHYITSRAAGSHPGADETRPMTTSQPITIHAAEPLPAALAVSGCDPFAWIVIGWSYHV